MTTSELIAQRARHFAQGDKHGQWLFAADVACCVEKGAGGGGPRAGTDPAPGKVSIREFARLAGSSDTTVGYYLAAWDAAARDGLVTPAAELTPDSEPVLPPAERWGDYAASFVLTYSTPERRAAVEQAAAAAGVAPSSVARMLSSPNALAAAIEADAAAAATARLALNRRDSRARARGAATRSQSRQDPAARQPRPQEPAAGTSPGYTRQAVEAMTQAVEHEHDFAGWLAATLAQVAVIQGSSDALTAGRPGSWEASLVSALLRGTVGEHDERLHPEAGQDSAMARE